MTYFVIKTQRVLQEYPGQGIFSFFFSFIELIFVGTYRELIFALCFCFLLSPLPYLENFHIFVGNKTHGLR